MAVAADVVRDAGDAEASLLDVLSAVLEANRQLSEAMAGLRGENALLREQNARLLERDAERKAEGEGLRADLAVLQRMLFGRSSEKSRPGPSGGDDTGGSGDAGRERGSGNVKRGPGARAGRRDYSQLPRFEVFRDFPRGGYCRPECGEPFTPLGDHWSGEQPDWQVIVRLVAHCRRRYKRACGCRVLATVLVVTRKNARGSRNGDSARNAAVIWTVTAAAQMADLNILTWLADYLDECGRNGAKPLTGPALERFLTWNASPEDLRTWA